MKKLNFSQMLESYKTSGLKSLSTIFVNEEASEEEFNAELEKAKKKAEGKDKSEVAKASVQAVQNEGYAQGPWHVKDEQTGQIHSTHPTYRKASNQAEKLNATDYEQNKDNPERNQHNLFHHKYSLVSAEHHDAKAEQLKAAREGCNCKEEVESIDEVSRNLLSRFIDRTKNDEKRQEGRNLALKKKWGDKEYGLTEPKVKATESVESIDESSKEKLTNYIANASRNLVNLGTDKASAAAHSSIYGMSGNTEKSDEEDAKRAEIDAKSRKRASGITLAALKLKRKIPESVELDEARKPSPITGTRKIASFEGDHGHTAEVRYHPDWNEYQVHHYKDGKHLGEKNVSYHGDDKQDAIDTAKHEIGINEQFDKSKVDTEQLKAEHASLLNVNTPSAISARKAITAELEKRGISESCLSPEEKEEKEKIVKGMKKNLSSFKERYGNRAKEVMYATATKNAQGK